MLAAFAYFGVGRALELADAAASSLRDPVPSDKTEISAHKGSNDSA
ncbi:MAG: hypothetical protein LBJ02_04610 [Bifidobacteriaceae bacterium]|nr:hypothetical protein [Bifidobacteriaceae bacterium]